MNGETYLNKLLQTMQATHNTGDYVFCVVNDLAIIHIKDIILFFREAAYY